MVAAIPAVEMAAAATKAEAAVAEMKAAEAGTDQAPARAAAVPARRPTPARSRAAPASLATLSPALGCRPAAAGVAETRCSCLAAMVVGERMAAAAAVRRPAR